MSKPVSERELMIFVQENAIGSILEIGIGSGERVRRMLPLCRKAEGVAQIRYAGVDPFESAATGVPHMNLKGAHRMLAEFGVKAHLIPGEISSAIARVANTVLPSDLIIIDGEWASTSDAGKAMETWLPRLSHSGSTIFAATTRGSVLSRIATPSNAIDSSVTRKVA
jgi:hypothetical protein